MGITAKAIIPCEHPDHTSPDPNNPALGWDPLRCPGGDLRFLSAGTTSTGHTGAVMIDLTEAHAYFHKGTGDNGDIDTWFVPVDGPGTYRLTREDR